LALILRLSATITHDSGNIFSPMGTPGLLLKPIPTFQVPHPLDREAPTESKLG